MKDTRDMRDPQKLGETILVMRGKDRSGGTLSSLCDEFDMIFANVASYDDGGHISSDPALHHSKTRQDTPVEAA